MTHDFSMYPDGKCPPIPRHLEVQCVRTPIEGDELIDLDGKIIVASCTWNPDYRRAILGPKLPDLAAKVMALREGSAKWAIVMAMVGVDTTDQDGDDSLSILRPLIKDWKVQEPYTLALSPVPGV